MDPVTLIGTVASLLTAARSLPQVAKLARSRSADGVSVAALAITVVAQTGWAAYGVAFQVWPMVAACVVNAAGHVVATVQTARRQRSARSALRVAGPFALACAAAGLAGGWTGLSLALMAVPVMTGVALLRGVTSSRRARDLSSGMLTLMVVEAVLWLTYLAALREFVLVANSALFLALTVATGLAARAARRRPQIEIEAAATV